eukprot:m51a1_g13836 hypothetical protein (244) ;mRNA; f:510976-511998
MALWRYKNGPWDGFITIAGKKTDVFLDLEFEHSGTFSGTGVSDALGSFNITGQTQTVPPFGVSAQIGDRAFTGFRESATSGFFGEWKLKSDEWQAGPEGEGPPKAAEGFLSHTPASPKSAGSFSFKPSTERAEEVRARLSSVGVKQLQAMGYDEPECEAALREAGGSVSRAAEILASRPAERTEEDDVALAIAQSQQSPDEGGASQEKITTIMEVGFSEEQARQALEICDGNVEAACEFLLSS